MAERDVLWAKQPGLDAKSAFRESGVTRTTEIGLLAGFVWLAAVALAYGEDEPLPIIPWRSGPAVFPESGKSESTQPHALVRLSANPSTQERAALREQGIELLDYVADTVWFARCASNRGEQGLSAKSAASTLPVTATAPVVVEWKLHPILLRGDCPKHAQLPRPPDAPETTKAADWVAVYVLFFRDVDVDTDARDVVVRHGGIIRDRARLAHMFVVELPLDAVPALAQEDEVQWIEPALPALSPTNDGCRALLQVNALQEAPYGLDGSGISVMLYDSGIALAAHPDFGGRLHLRDEGELANHSTHVAGTIGGSGANSASQGGSSGQWRGMAPGVWIESYAHKSSGTGVLLYSNPGDLEADCIDAVLNYGADLANNSLGSNVASNGFDCDITGDYGVTSNLIDTIVRGAIGRPFRSIWALGNERGTLRCGILYATIAPPAGAKNHITVGAVYSDDDTMTSFSSWGPTDDGRLKPDVCAPGDERAGDLGVTSTSSTSGYYVNQGTSMACPTVTGICALLLQGFRARFSGRPDPTNAALKVLLAHTAVDRGNTGPDYRFGFGSVRAKEAVDFMRSGNFLDGTVGDAQTALYSVTVSSGDSVLKATLAWDDFPGTPNVEPALVNDLDVLAVSPSGVIHFPWTLDPDAPEAAATRDAPDRVNNIEQVVVENPEAGTWHIEVIGYTVPQGPQPFTLTASPSLLLCTDLGCVAFNAGAYSCASTASFTLTDCQLDASPSRVDTASVHVFSTSDATGQPVPLTETGMSTGTFTGSVPLDALGGTGMVRVADGDTLTIEYEDEDGGDGQAVVVTDEVPIDCEPPSIAQTTVTNTASTAVLQFQINEPARSLIRYGTACGEWTGQQPEHRYLSEHSIWLTGLAPETEHFFVVNATDLAGNTVFADNGGACFSFTTDVRPDFFAELFEEEDVDVAHGTLVFTPNASVSGYVAEFTPGVLALPTDPAGGIPLELEDDDSAEVVLAGSKRVRLYGLTFSRFWVGSNGYLNFESEDTIQAPAFTHHFSARRVSGFFQDLDPSTETGGGSVSWRQLDDHVAVTWQAVPEWDKPSRLNTFQIRMGFDGGIAISWLELGSPNGMAGLSQGLGVSPDFTESDLSAYEKQTLVLDPVGNKSVMEGGLLAFPVSAQSPIRVPALTAQNLPDGATFVDNENGIGHFAWQTELGHAGVYPDVRFTASDREETREEVVTIFVERFNLPPTASNAAIAPPTPSTFTTLQASYEYADPEGDPEGASEIRWFRNGNPIPDKMRRLALTESRMMRSKGTRGARRNQP